MDDGDPIAAALRAKAERLKAAAAAAAKAVPPQVTTVLADDVPAKPPQSAEFAPPPNLITELAKGNSNQDASKQDQSSQQLAQPATAEPAPAQAAQSAKRLVDVSDSDEEDNPLAALLGYGADSSDGERSEDSTPTHSPKRADRDKTDAASVSSGDVLDQELASFMEELEESGLLEDGTPVNAPQDLSTADRPLSTTPPTTSLTEGPTPFEFQAQAAAAEQSAVPADVPDAVMVDADLAAGQQPEDAAATEAEAEQKVLGYLAQAPEWCKCLDTGSGRVYYWNLTTNEVVWEVPEGFDGDSLLPPDYAESAEAVAEQSTQAVAAAGEAGAEAEEAAAVAELDLDALTSVDRRQTPNSAHAEQQTQAVGAPTLNVQESKPRLGSADVQASTPADAPQPMDVEAQEGTPDASLTRSQAQQIQQRLSEGGLSTASSTAERLSHIEGLLLQRPQQEMTGVLSALLDEVQKAARYFLASMPLVVRLAIEAEVRLSDWQSMSSAQSTAVEVQDPETAHCWGHYEEHTMKCLKQLLERLPLAMEDVQSTAGARCSAPGSNTAPGTTTLGRTPTAVSASAAAPVPAALAQSQAGLQQQGAPTPLVAPYSPTADISYSPTNVTHQAARPSVSPEPAQGLHLSHLTAGSAAANAAAVTQQLEEGLEDGELAEGQLPISDASAAAKLSSGVAAPSVHAADKAAPLKTHNTAKEAGSSFSWSAHYNQNYSAENPLGLQHRLNLPHPTPKQVQTKAQAAQGPHPAMDESVPPLPSEEAPPLPTDHPSQDYPPGLEPTSGTPPLPPDSSLPPLPSDAPADDDMQIEPLPATVSSAPALTSGYSSYPGYHSNMLMYPTLNQASFSALQFVNSYLGIPDSVAYSFATPQPYTVGPHWHAPMPVSHPSLPSDMYTAPVTADPALPAIPHVSSTESLLPASQLPSSAALVDAGLAAVSAATGATAAATAYPAPEAVALVEAAAPVVGKKKEYRAEPVRNPAAAAIASAPVLREVSPSPPPTTTGGFDLFSLHDLDDSSVLVSAPNSWPAATSPPPMEVEADKKRKKEKAGGGPSKKAKLPGKMSALVGQWSAKRKELEDEEAAAAARAAEQFDPEALERRRAAEIQKWKEQQMSKPTAAEENPNLMPLGDWRSRFPNLQQSQQPTTSTSTDLAPSSTTSVTASKASSKSKKAASTSVASASASKPTKNAVNNASAPTTKYPTNSATKPDLEALSEGLPAGWKAMWDKDSGDIYYGNLKTRELSVGG